MDWFFREYVYGTDLPAYHFEGDATPSGDGWKLAFQVGASRACRQNSKYLCRIYLELANGRVMRLGQIAIHGRNSRSTRPCSCPSSPQPIKRVLINYYYDVLCTDN